MWGAFFIAIPLWWERPRCHLILASPGDMRPHTPVVKITHHPEICLQRCRVAERRDQVLPGDMRPRAPKPRYSRPVRSSCTYLIVPPVLQATFPGCLICIKEAIGLYKRSHFGGLNPR